MNFQDLKTVGTPDFYLDVAIKRTKKRIEESRDVGLRGSPIQRSKTIELTKLETIEMEIKNQLYNVLKSYPSLDNLPEFYQELIRVTLDYGMLKKSLGAMMWCIEKNHKFLNQYKGKIKMSTEPARINQYRREFLGRVSSTLKQIKENLAYLEEARKTMQDYPSIKTGIPTIAIAGFPNVGKSTLLSKITTAKPKIAPYAFTTQGINLGYAEYQGKKIQFMDTPGTLSRFEKQNNIEKVATLAMKYLAEAVIYVFDPTESYPIEKQVELYELTKSSTRPMILYLSKTDVADKKSIEKFTKMFKGIITNTDDLKKEIEKLKFFEWD